MNNFRGLCDELRCWDTDRLREQREVELREARRHDARALAMLRTTEVEMPPRKHDNLPL